MKKSNLKGEIFIARKELKRLKKLREIYVEMGYITTKLDKRIDILETQIDIAIKELL